MFVNKICKHKKIRDTLDIPFDSESNYAIAKFNQGTDYSAQILKC